MISNIDTDSILHFPVLVGDIGGTNARFAILVDSYAEPKQFPTLQTADYETIDDAIQSAVLDHTSIQPRSAVLAIAGPVEGDEIDLTNCPWVVKPKQMMETLGLEDIIVVNDFEAQALAVASLESEYLEKIGGGEGEPNGSRVVLGPGTGLGVAGLIRTRQTWVPVPGEGGHVDFGPRSERDFEIFPHLERIEGRISAEQLLCGRGLQNIYHAVCKANGVAPALATPAEITGAALDDSSKEARETLQLFVVYLGRLSGDFALTFMALGGIYLAGGIVQRIIPALKDPSFREAFEDKAPHEDILKTVPVYVITHPLAALSGLSAYARTPSRFGVPTEGRRWRKDA
ncbi:glucokinase [Phyllobacterium phragmitis]|uniref:Glucokinase n=1 Tax=Phyllobacterium phragmitis TaxID=2670329 RepID=A0A2S9IRZ9_9HYPH|nr:glucokinase [Phyllobacterium phragmitis]PRD43296.1 glucokinase [Phyllobacterium phragmitis]